MAGYLSFYFLQLTNSKKSYFRDHNMFFGNTEMMCFVPGGGRDCCGRCTNGKDKRTFVVHALVCHPFIQRGQLRIFAVVGDLAAAM
jgi:hypothetical protein